MDLSKLSTEDLQALQSGDLTKVSTAGLQSLQGGTSYLDKVKGNVLQTGKEFNQILAGGMRGAAGIGATLLMPTDALNDKLTGRTDTNQQRRQDIDGALQGLGADSGDYGFKTGKLGAEVAGTAGVPGLLGKVAAPVLGGVAPKLVNALASNGMTIGAPAATTLGKVGDMAIRSIGGAAGTGAQVGLVDPNSAGIGAGIGAAVPPVVRVAGALGSGLANLEQTGARKLMGSALKPTKAEWKAGIGDTAVDTALEYGINPSKAGVAKARDLIDELNTKISNALGNSNAVIDPQNVVNALASTRQKFGNQVSPTADLKAIDNIRDDFLNTSGAGPMPVQLAQKVKQGTYSVLAGKYGQLGSAETEAQKGLARGLKEDIASAIPEIGPLNAEEGRLLSTLSVAERRAFMNMNNNPIGISGIAHNPVAWAAMMADKSPAFKALVARTLNASASPGARATAQNLLQTTSNPLLRANLLAANQGTQQ